MELAARCCSCTNAEATTAVGHRKRRCSPLITTVSLCARGYPLSDVPDDTNQYFQDITIADTLYLLDHLGLVTSLLVGLSMGVLHNGHNTAAE